MSKKSVSPFALFAPLSLLASGLIVGLDSSARADLVFETDLSQPAQKSGVDDRRVDDRRLAEKPSPLALTITKNDLRGVRSLLEKGADVNAISCLRGEPIVSGGWVTTTKGCHYETSKEPGPIECETPLQRAAQHSSEAMVDVLLKHGANPNLHGPDGMMPLQSVLSLRARRAEVEAMGEALLKHGANPNLSGPTGLMPLQAAVSKHLPRIVALLIAKGANVNVAGDYGRTPLHVAVHEADLEIAKLLIAAGANVNARVTDGFTPLHYAALINNPEIVTVLLQAGADVKLLDNDGLTPLDIASTRNSKDAEQVLIKVHTS